MLNKSIFEESLTEGAVYVTLLKSVKQGMRYLKMTTSRTMNMTRTQVTNQVQRIILERTFLYMKTAGDHRHRYGRQTFVICGSSERHGMSMV